jgi:hypothetical protein
MKRFFRITVNENESPCSPKGIKMADDYGDRQNAPQPYRFA